MTSRIELIKEKITEALSPTQLEIIDDSQHHVGHAGAASGGGHYTVRIATPAFEGKNRVACHQLIYAALGEMMQAEIHALRIEIV
ncbi:MAG: cell division protein BolA [marine bacterium B5-7]|nr:MAG: cell division protein BolA [marine bacterium B5-7]